MVPIHKKGDKIDCSNYRGTSFLSTSYKILSNILLARLTPYADEIIGDHQRGFRRNRRTTDQIFYIRQTEEKKWEYNTDDVNIVEQNRYHKGNCRSSIRCY
jgi:hypothetical protein